MAWHPPGVAAPSNNWRYDLARGWVKPGDPSDRRGIQYGMDEGFDPDHRNVGWHVLSSLPGAQAPVDAINYTPDTREVHAFGMAAPKDKLNLSVIPDSPGPAQLGNVGMGQDQSPWQQNQNQLGPLGITSNSPWSTQTVGGGSVGMGQDDDGYESLPQGFQDNPEIDNGPQTAPAPAQSVADDPNDPIVTTSAGEHMRKSEADRRGISYDVNTTLAPGTTTTATGQTRWVDDNSGIPGGHLIDTLGLTIVDSAGNIQRQPAKVPAAKSAPSGPPISGIPNTPFVQVRQPDGSYAVVPNQAASTGNNNVVYREVPGKGLTAFDARTNQQIRPGGGLAGGSPQTGTQQPGGSRPTSIDTSSPDAFVASLRPLAQSAEARTGIPADVIVAIAANESGWGKFTAGGDTGSNNIFGMKQSENTWQRFATPQDAVDAFANLISQNSRYASALQTARAGDKSGFIQQLANAGYIQPDEAAAWVRQIGTIAGQVPGMGANGYTSGAGAYTSGDQAVGGQPAGDNGLYVGDPSKAGTWTVHALPNGKQVLINNVTGEQRDVPGGEAVTKPRNPVVVGNRLMEWDPAQGKYVETLHVDPNLQHFSTNEGIFSFNPESGAVNLVKPKGGFELGPQGATIYPGSAVDFQDYDPKTKQTTTRTVSSPGGPNYAQQGGTPVGGQPQTVPPVQQPPRPSTLPPPMDAAGSPVAPQNQTAPQIEDQQPEQYSVPTELDDTQFNGQKPPLTVDPLEDPEFGGGQASGVGYGQAGGESDANEFFMIPVLESFAGDVGVGQGDWHEGEMPSSWSDPSGDLPPVDPERYTRTSGPMEGPQSGGYTTPDRYDSGVDPREVLRGQSAPDPRTLPKMQPWDTGYNPDSRNFSAPEPGGGMTGTPMPSDRGGGINSQPVIPTQGGVYIFVPHPEMQQQTSTPAPGWEPRMTSTPRPDSGGGIAAAQMPGDQDFRPGSSWDSSPEDIGPGRKGSSVPAGGFIGPAGPSDYSDVPGFGSPRPKKWQNYDPELQEGYYTTSPTPANIQSINKQALNDPNMGTMDNSDERYRLQSTYGGKIGQGQGEPQTVGADPMQQQGQSGGWQPPIDPSQVVGGGNKFGDQVSMEGTHEGTDLQAYKGTPVVSPIDGTVVDITYDPKGLGLQVIVRAADGVNHTLAHLDQAHVQIGQQVKIGEPLGQVGESGDGATGPHLDYRMQGPAGQSINPEPMLGALGQLPPAPGTVGENDPSATGTGQGWSPQGRVGWGQDEGDDSGFEIDPNASGGAFGVNSNQSTEVRDLGDTQTVVPPYKAPSQFGSSVPSQGNAQSVGGAGSSAGYASSGPAAGNPQVPLTTVQKTNADLAQQRIDQQTKQNETAAQAEQDRHSEALATAKNQQEVNAENNRHNQEMEQIQRDQNSISQEANRLGLIEKGTFQQQQQASLAQSALKNPWLQNLTGMTPGFGQPGWNSQTGGGTLQSLLNGWTPQGTLGAAGISDSGLNFGDNTGGSSAGFAGNAPLSGLPPMPTYDQWQQMSPFEQVAWRTATEMVQPWEATQSQLQQFWASQPSAAQKATSGLALQAPGTNASAGSVGSQMQAPGVTAMPGVTQQQAMNMNPRDLQATENTAGVFGQTPDELWKNSQRQWSQAAEPTVSQSFHVPNQGGVGTGQGRGWTPRVGRGQEAPQRGWQDQLGSMASQAGPMLSQMAQGIGDRASAVMAPIPRFLFDPRYNPNMGSQSVVGQGQGWTPRSRRVGVGGGPDNTPGRAPYSGGFNDPTQIVSRDDWRTFNEYPETHHYPSPSPDFQPMEHYGGPVPEYMEPYRGPALNGRQ